MSTFREFLKEENINSNIKKAIKPLLGKIDTSGYDLEDWISDTSSISNKNLNSTTDIIYAIADNKEKDALKMIDAAINANIKSGWQNQDSYEEELINVMNIITKKFKK